VQQPAVSHTPPASQQSVVSQQPPGSQQTSVAQQAASSQQLAVVERQPTTVEQQLIAQESLVLALESIWSEDTFVDRLELLKASVEPHATTQNRQANTIPDFIFEFLFGTEVGTGGSFPFRQRESPVN